VLHGVEQALQQAIVEAEQRERALPPPAGAVPAVEQDPAWQQELRRWEERWQRLEAVARQAEQRVVEVDATLRAEEESLRGWLTAVATTGQKLADGPRHEV
jgi:hypothetical protein